MVTPHQQDARGGGGRVLARRYHLQRVLGRGAMGAVWEAEDTVLRRPVAVKEVVLPPGLSPEERAVSCERTLREARAIARLGHPNVVTLFDVLDEDSRPWVVMELVPSRSLADVISADGPIHPLRAATVGLAILGALEAAHAAGITHRDVKPGNILLGHDGRVKLTDFGIARAAGDTTITGTGLLVGSPSYLAPEIVRGLESGPAGDLWGLGATLYAAVEGRAPFSGTDPMDTLAKVVQEPPAPFERAGPMIPALTAMLEKDPARRAGPVAARRLLLDVLRGGNEDFPQSGPVGQPPAVAASLLSSTMAAPAPAGAAGAPAGGGAGDPEAPNLANQLATGRDPGGASQWGVPGQRTAADQPAAAGPPAPPREPSLADQLAAGREPGAASPWGGPGERGAPSRHPAPDQRPTPDQRPGGREPDTAGERGAQDQRPAADQQPAPDQQPAADQRAAGRQPGAAGEREAAAAAAVAAAVGTAAGAGGSGWTAGPGPASGTVGGPTGGQAEQPERAENAEPAEAERVERDTPHGAAAEPPGSGDTDLAATVLAEPVPAEPEHDGFGRGGAAPPFGETAPFLPLAGPPAGGRHRGTNQDPPDEPVGGGPVPFPEHAAPSDAHPGYAYPGDARPGGVGPGDGGGPGDRGGRPDQFESFGAPGDQQGWPAGPPGYPPPGHHPPGQFPPGQFPPGYLPQGGRSPDDEPTEVVESLGFGGFGGFSGEPQPADSRRRRTTVAMLAVAALVLIATIGGYLATRSFFDRPANSGPTTSSEPAPTTPAAGAVPAGFSRYRHPDGFSVAVPQAWQAEPRRAGVVDVREPEASRFLRLIRSASDTDPLAQLAAAEPGFRRDHTGYRRVRLEKVDYRGYPAADWEFTYDNGGETRHVLYHVFVVNGASYGIYLSAPDDQWSASLRYYETAAATFVLG